MFKFDEYPEIKKAYKEQNRLKNICNRAEKKIKPNDEDSKLCALVAVDNLISFNQNTFALLIYNTFQIRQPRLYHQFKGFFADWDKVFPDKWENVNEEQKNHLLGLVQEIGCGQYWLPDEYYDDQLIDGCIKPPKTHTKPFKCW